MLHWQHAHACMRSAQRVRRAEHCAMVPHRRAHGGSERVYYIYILVARRHFKL